MMKNSESAGESRRGRRLVLRLAMWLMGAAAIFAWSVTRGTSSVERGAWSVEQQYSRPDSSMALALLQNVQGANAVLCGAVERVFQMGNWGMNSMVQPDANADEIARWIGKNHLGRSVLDVARRYFNDPDDCKRRIAARLAGGTDVKRLDEELRAELTSNDATIRLAAVRAVGYDGASTSLRRLMGMLDDRDRLVRLTVIWSLGRVGDEGASAALVSILQHDTDADARRLAAYALGQIHG